MSRALRRLLRHRTPAVTRALAVAGAAVLVLAAAGTALATHDPGPAAPGQVATAADSGLAGATLRVLSGMPLLSVRVGDLGGRDGTLVRVATPAGDPVRPQLRETGSGNAAVVRLSLAPGTGPGSAASPVTVTLNAAVTWGLLFAGGTHRTDVDPRGGWVTALAFTAGSSVVDVTLPRPHGTLPLLLTGGASRRC